MNEGELRSSNKVEGSIKQNIADLGHEVLIKCWSATVNKNRHWFRLYMAEVNPFGGELDSLLSRSSELVSMPNYPRKHEKTTRLDVTRGLSKSQRPTSIERRRYCPTEKAGEVEDELLLLRFVSRYYSKSIVICG